jgi:uncharacterized protein (DUF2461 family)
MKRNLSGNEVRYILRSERINLRQLADKLGISPQTLNSRLNAGEVKTSFLEDINHALGQELFRPFADKPGNLLKVSRIYRDARLRHPLPYKESLWICIRQEVSWWAENPCLYFEIRPEGVSYGFVLWRPGVSTMQSIREDIAARPEEFLKLIADTEAAVGQPVTAELYRRPTQTAVAELAPYFAWKGNISCVVEEEVGPAIFSPALAERAGVFLEKLIPLYDYFNRFKN